MVNKPLSVSLIIFCSFSPDDRDKNVDKVSLGDLFSVRKAEAERYNNVFCVREKSWEKGRRRDETTTHSTESNFRLQKGFVDLSGGEKKVLRPLSTA